VTVDEVAEVATLVVAVAATLEVAVAATPALVAAVVAAEAPTSTLRTTLLSRRWVK
jgi:hypothetical protein